MKIYIVSAIGEGETPLSAFDSALQKTGVYNYNLLPLSSVIPPNSELVMSEQYNSPEHEYGHKLYVVKAEMRSDHVGKWVGAGLGWFQLADGRGVFVEHETTGDTEDVVRSILTKSITRSVSDLCTFRGYEFTQEDIKMHIVAGEVKLHPVCALALAVYQSEGWR